MAAFVLPANIVFLKRGKPVVRIHLPANGTVVTLREDGVVNFWTPKLYLKSKKNVFVSYIYISFGYVSCIPVPALLHFLMIWIPYFIWIVSLSLYPAWEICHSKTKMVYRFCANARVQQTDYWNGVNCYFYITFFLIHCSVQNLLWKFLPMANEDEVVNLQLLQGWFTWIWGLLCYSVQVELVTL